MEACAAWRLGKDLEVDQRQAVTVESVDSQERATLLERARLGVKMGQRPQQHVRHYLANTHLKNKQSEMVGMNQNPHP